MSLIATNIIDLSITTITTMHYAHRAIMLERCVKRLEWERVRDKEQKDADDEAERERNAMQAIDW